MMKKLFALLLALSLCLGAAQAEGDGMIPLDAWLTERGEGMGMWVTFSTEDLRPWQEELGLYGTLLDEVPEGWVSREAAESSARASVLSMDELLYPQSWYGIRKPEVLTEETLASLQCSAFLAAQNEIGQDVWYVFLYDPAWLVELLDCYEVVLDAHTGEVLWAFTPGGNG